MPPFLLPAYKSIIINSHYLSLIQISLALSTAHMNNSHSKSLKPYVTDVSLPDSSYNKLHNATLSILKEKIWQCRRELLHFLV